MKRILAVLVVLVGAGAFAGGYWPQRQARARAEQEAAQAKEQLSQARADLARVQARDRRGRLLGRLLALQDALASGNFGEARVLSTPFFDGVRDEAAAETDAKVRASLDAILARRDAVTAALARGEASVREALVTIEGDLRRSLGYPVSSPAPAKAAAAEATP
jgi:hypothetical protein